MNGFYSGTLSVLAFLIFLVWGFPASGQIVNFKPLERGEYEEEEEELFILRGIRVSGDYAIRLGRDKHEDLPHELNKSTTKQDFRLDLRTVFHRDIEMQLVLQTRPSEFDSTRLRATDEDQDRNSTSETPALSLSAREAFLRYKFNPGSALLLGKHEISLGDRRGKTFNGIAPGVTYDCKVGTWCMPFGVIKIGEESSDWIFHWALEYTAWEEKNSDGLSDHLKVEIFRILYTENNVPLGTNRGPAVFDRNDPDNPSSLHPSQAVDSAGSPIFYDAENQDYFGLRVNFESSGFFWNFDVVSNQGRRRMHRYRDSSTGAFLDFEGNEDFVFLQKVSGIAVESEIGFRWIQGRVGFRMLGASGDPAVAPENPAGLLRGLDGFFEITPGSYQGSRLYFNGNDGTVENGAGLGHSINNTEMFGVFYDFSDPDDMKMDYSFGLYKLEKQHPIFDALGYRQKAIGIELNSLLSFYIHKALRLQIETNAIRTGKAFTVNDYQVPSGRNTELFVQGILRLVYSF